MVELRIHGRWGPGWGDLRERGGEILTTEGDTHHVRCEPLEVDDFDEPDRQPCRHARPAETSAGSPT
jgi:hypothetical protein